MNVVAEGIETVEQYAFLNEQECDEIQGYSFSAPNDAEAFKHLLQSKQWINYQKIESQREGNVLFYRSMQNGLKTIAMMYESS